MQQVIITISNDHPHKKDIRISEYRHWLQSRLDAGIPWSQLLASIEDCGNNQHYFKIDTTQTLINGLNKNDMTNCFAVLNIPPQPLEDVLHPENWVAENPQETAKPLTFEQHIYQYKKADPAFLSFVNHMHQKVSEKCGDADLIDDYNNVMNTLWAVFNIGGWNDEERAYLDAIDYFRDKYEVGVQVLKRIKVGSEVMTLDGDIKIVESFHLVPERYLRDSQYNIAIVFQGHETIMYNGNGLVDTDWVYHPDNIISIDGGTN